MMRFGLVATLMVLLAAHGARAGAATVCGRSEVVERLSILLSQAGRPMQLEAGSVGEVSAGVARVVHCAVRGRVVDFDTNQHGMQPIDATFVVQYTLELRQNGIFLHLD